MQVVMNLLRNHKKKRFSRHYKHPDQNRTLCGLSMVSGHAWDVSKVHNVNCATCLKIHKRLADMEALP